MQIAHKVKVIETSDPDNIKEPYRAGCECGWQGKRTYHSKRVAEGVSIGHMLEANRDN